MKYLYIFLIITIAWLAISLFWYYMPHKFLNINYESINKDVYDLEKPFILVSTHHLNTAEIMIMCNESRKFKQKINIVAHYNIDTVKEILQQFFKELPLFTPYNKINVHHRKKSNTIDKLKKCIDKNESVLMFYFRDQNKSGLYNLIKEKNIPILLAKFTLKNKDKITEKDRDPLYTLNGNYNLEYKLLNEYPKKNKEDFNDHINKELYYQKNI